MVTFQSKVATVGCVQLHTPGKDNVLKSVFPGACGSHGCHAGVLVNLH